MLEKGPTTAQRRQQSDIQRERNRNTVKIVRIANAYLVTNGDTNETFSYHSLDEVEAHIREFFPEGKHYPADIFDPNSAGNVYDIAGPSRR